MVLLYIYIYYQASNLLNLLRDIAGFLKTLLLYSYEVFYDRRIYY